MCGLVLIMMMLKLLVILLISFFLSKWIIFSDWFCERYCYVFVLNIVFLGNVEMVFKFGYWVGNIMFLCKNLVFICILFGILFSMILIVE